MESGNGDGLDNYYTSAGLNFIFRTGNEYDAPYFKVMNPRQWPGTTAEQGNSKLPSVEWGKNSRNNNPYAGGVSDQQYGTIGFIYDKKSLKATKSWFYFDNEFVALGTNISQRFGKDTVMTTLNQTLQKSTIVYAENEQQQFIETGSGTRLVTNPLWILQDNIGYINLQETSNFIIRTENINRSTIFSLGIDHGKNPKNESYAYIVYPNSTETDLQNYVDTLPIQILSNTKEAQAVYHKTLKITQIHFYKAGTILLSDSSTVTVDKPCAVMITEKDSTIEISVGNPLCESKNPERITLQFSKFLMGDQIKTFRRTSTFTIELPQGDFAGKSVTIRDKR
jgi:chondroitin AC lyase